jgi:hypothetical protein
MIHMRFSIGSWHREERQWGESRAVAVLSELLPDGVDASGQRRVDAVRRRRSEVSLHEVVRKVRLSRRVKERSLVRETEPVHEAPKVPRPEIQIVHRTPGAVERTGRNVSDQHAELARFRHERVKTVTDDFQDGEATAVV